MVARRGLLVKAFCFIAGLVSASAQLGALKCPDSNDFGINYKNESVLVVSKANHTCYCKHFATPGNVTATLVAADTVQTQASIVHGPLMVNGVDVLGRIVELEALLASLNASCQGKNTFATGLTVTGGSLSVNDGLAVNIGKNGTTAAALNVRAVTVFTGPVTISAGGLTVNNGQAVNIGTSGTTSVLNVFGTTNLNGNLDISASSTVSVASTATFNVPGLLTVGNVSATSVSAQNFGDGTSMPLVNSVRSGKVSERMTVTLLNTICSAYLNESITVTVPASYTSGLRYRIVWNEMSIASVAAAYFSFWANVSTNCTAYLSTVSPLAYSTVTANYWRMLHGEFYYTFPAGTTTLYWHVKIDRDYETTVTFANADGDKQFQYAYAVPA
eukprot:TRINITY_DN6050_c0_g1_i1.p1 TRINITY_DN6050_c0_g1~~TRINITY_DN6050_c0_g1_i1.p1  ORF type:complete len:387 (-),score=113.65 TRINITY_DN6050_c0_g1_i1:76-1236(-)